jgi:hypothetical protein
MFRRFLVSCVACLLCGCVTIPPRDPALLQALASIRIVEVVVEAAPAVETGLPGLDGVPPSVRVSQLIATVERDLENRVAGLMGGTVPARIVARINTVDLASDVGYALLERDSFIIGSVRIEAISDRRPIAFEPVIASRDASFHGNSTIALVVNVAAALSQDRVQKASQGFAEAVRTWLVAK